MHLHEVLEIRLHRDLDLGFRMRGHPVIVFNMSPIINSGIRLQKDELRVCSRPFGPGTIAMSWDGGCPNLMAVSFSLTYWFRI